MSEKDYILNLCLQIKLLLYEVMEEEHSCNEGSLSMHYEEILELLLCIEKERLMHLAFWGDDLNE